MLAVEGSRSVRLFVLAVLSVATTGIFVISMRANYLYGRSIGQSPETQEAMAWANVGADIWKAFGLIIVAGLWRNRRRRAAAATFCAWAICLCFSVMSAIGIYVQERTTLTGGRQVQQADLADARAELAALEEQLKSRGQQSTPSEVEAAIAALLARPVIVGERARGTVGGISNNCTRADPRTLTLCAEVASLQRALASARETMTLAGASWSRAQSNPHSSGARCGAPC